MVTFSQTPTFQSDENFALDVSEDGEAWTLTFEGFELHVGGGESPPPTATRTFFLVITFEGYDEDDRVEMDFHVQGSVLTLAGGTATVVLSVNGQTTVADFPANSDQSYLQSLKFTAPSPPSECRLCGFLLAGRDSKNSNAEAFISATAIDANIPSAPAR